MDNSNATKKCNYCGMDIAADARRCSYCGSLLEVYVDSNAFGSAPHAEKPQEFGTETGGFQYGSRPEGFGSRQSQTDNGPQPAAGPAPNSGEGFHRDYGQHYGQQYQQPANGISYYKPLSNGLKVFLTIIFTIIPGLGQLAGIITAIIFMNADGDSDRKSFGVAILIASVIMFVLSCIVCFGASLFYSVNQSVNIYR